jgi:hypothetical protein
MAGREALEAAAEPLAAPAAGDLPGELAALVGTYVVEGRPMHVVVSGWPFDRVD